MSIANTIIQRLLDDPTRAAALTLAREENLPQWCISAGFVRNVGWDIHHGYSQLSPLTDIDVIYFQQGGSKEQDEIIQARLMRKLDINWSIKNQARMHERNGDNQYANTVDAMSYWPEVETAVGITWAEGRYKLVSPFCMDEVLSCSITLNPKRPKPAVWRGRIQSKRWLEQWPKLEVRPQVFS